MAFVCFRIPIEFYHQQIQFFFSPNRMKTEKSRFNNDDDIAADTSEHSMSQRASLALARTLRSGLGYSPVPSRVSEIAAVRRIGGLVKAQRRQSDLTMTSQKPVEEARREPATPGVHTAESVIEILHDNEALELLKRDNSPLRLILVKAVNAGLDDLNSGDFSKIKETIQLIQLLMERKITLDMKPSAKILRDIICAPHPHKAFFKFNEHIKEILALPNSDAEKLDLIYKFMTTTHQIKLASSKSFEIAFTKPLTEQVVKIVLKCHQQHEFYKKLLEVESANISHFSTTKLRYTLRQGSSEDRALFEFRHMFKIEDEEEKNLAKATFVKLYSFDMIRQITMNAVKKRDNAAQEYLDLLMTRYVIESKTVEDLEVLNSRLYEAITYYTVRMGGYKSVLELLGIMHTNNIPLTAKIYHLLISSLRKFKLYDASLSMFRQAPGYFQDTEHFNDGKFRSLMVNELLALIRLKFPDDPKIFIAHFLTMFKQSEILLNDLGILKLVYQKEVGTLEDTSGIPKADLDPFYHRGNVFPTIENLTLLYMSVLDSIPNTHSTQSKTQIYVKLFGYFLRYASTIQSFESSNQLLMSHPFSKDHLDGSIVNIFIRHSLQFLGKPSIALSMAKRFLTRCEIKRFSGLNPDSIIEIFYKHPNLTGQAYHELLAILQQYNIEPTPKLMIAKIFKHNDRDEVALSQLWYKRLVDSGYEIRNRRLITFIVKHGWDFPENFDHALLDEMHLRNDKAFEDLTIYEDESEIDDPETINELNEKLKSFKKA